jgi:general secretion pathway protein G
VVNKKRRALAFTLVELLVVMAVMATLLSLAVPRYFAHLDRAKEAVLKHNLVAMRDAIDKFRADQARYPRDLAELVQLRYLRELPMDPITERRDTWRQIPPAGADLAGQVLAGQLHDVKSGAPGVSMEGGPYAAW